MINKILRTIIGLPFLLVLWFTSMFICMPIILVSGFVIDGNFKESKRMYKECPFALSKFFKNIWSK